MLEILQEFIDTRFECVVREYEYVKETSEDRKHLLEGLHIVILDIDKAVKIIRGSSTVKEAKQSLMKEFSIDENQADYVLSLTLSRLTQQDEHKIVSEIKNLEKDIDNAEKILANKKKQEKIILDSLEKSKKDLEPYGQRQTEIRDTFVEKKTVKKEASLGADKWGIDSRGFLSNTGTPIDSGITYAVYSNGDIKLFNGQGLPKSNTDVVPISPNIDELYTAGVVKDDEYIIIATKSGRALRLDPKKINAQGIAGQGVKGIKFKTEDDEIIGVGTAKETDGLLTISDQGWKVTDISTISVMGRGSSGVIVHKLRKGDTHIAVSYTHLTLPTKA